MATIPTKYSDEFKRDAAALVDSGITQKQVCRDQWERISEVERV